MAFEKQRSTHETTIKDLKVGRCVAFDAANVPSENTQKFPKAPLWICDGVGDSPPILKDNGSTQPSVGTGYDSKNRALQNHQVSVDLAFGPFSISGHPMGWS